MTFSQKVPDAPLQGKTTVFERQHKSGYSVPSLFPRPAGHPFCAGLSQGFLVKQHSISISFTPEPPIPIVHEKQARLDENNSTARPNGPDVQHIHSMELFLFLVAPFARRAKQHKRTQNAQAKTKVAQRNYCFGARSPGLGSASCKHLPGCQENKHV